jgi:hypothetical protein
MAQATNNYLRSSLDSKTVRPGLAAYSFYRSDRHPTGRAPVKPVTRRRSSGKSAKFVLTAVAVIAAAFIGYRSATAPDSSNAGAPVINVAQAAKAANPCDSGSLAKYVIVSITKRHMWVCQVHKQVYESPVITGMTLYESTKTPTGTYKIASKHTDTTLTGSDEAGSWNDPVRYWMPFLTNQYGTYGFHDATWRPGNPFGNIDPSSKDASHGCVELPIDASAWLYNWAEVGTTIAIET